MVESSSLIGISLKGGRKDQFYLCAFTYYAKEKRWFLESLTQSKSEQFKGGDATLSSWQYLKSARAVMLDVPLSRPMCETCLLQCPGQEECPQPSILKVRKTIDDILSEDQDLHQKHPKGYENNRVESLLYQHEGVDVNRTSSTHMMGKSFKRRLKKGFLPYWNRPIDLWLWIHYYDQMLQLFDLSFDSFGQSSLMNQFRLSYLRRHFPDNLDLFESRVPVILIEALRADWIRKKDLQELKNLISSAEARMNIIRSFEKKLNLFIYDKDFETLAIRPRAFESFILTAGLIPRIQGQFYDLPEWAHNEEASFCAPRFIS